MRYTVSSTVSSQRSTLLSTASQSFDELQGASPIASYGLETTQRRKPRHLAAENPLTREVTRGTRHELCLTFVKARDPTHNGSQQNSLILARIRQNSGPSLLFAGRARWVHAALQNPSNSQGKGPGQKFATLDSRAPWQGSICMYCNCWPALGQLRLAHTEPLSESGSMFVRFFASSAVSPSTSFGFASISNQVANSQISH